MRHLSEITEPVRRVNNPVLGYGDERNGFFTVRFGILELRIIASVDGEGWDHVSVTTSAARCPTWDEMEFVRELFFLPEECVVQYSPPRAERVNCHPYCLHLWRPINEPIPTPPYWMVGPKVRAKR